MSPYTSACTRSFHPQPTRIHPPEVARELEDPFISPLHLHHISTISPEVARELEDPFIHPPNEAPLVAVQQSFNARLLSGWGFPVLFQPL